MKLLNREQVKTYEREAKASLASELTQLQMSIEKSIKALNDEKQRKEVELASLRSNIEAVKLSHKDFVKRSQVDIAQLAKQKEDLSKPFNDREQYLNQKAGKLAEIENVLTVKQYEIAERVRQFEIGLKTSQGEVARLEKVRAEAEQAVSIARQAEQKIQGEKGAFLEKTEQFYKQKNEWDQKFNTEMKAMDGRNRALDGYAAMLNDKEESLNNLQKRLQSDRLALDAAKREIYGRS